MMDVDAYLERIDYRGSTRPSEIVLRRLHRKHMLSIPFENLDIHSHRPIVLSEDAIYDKIVNRHRGGFCYELNGLFCNLLRELGFRVSMLSARVAMKTGKYGAEYDHMTLQVQLKEQVLADVGFGDSFTEPKNLETSDPQPDHGRDYKLSRKNNWIKLSRREKGSHLWTPQYKFTLKPRTLEDYVPRCKWQQTSHRSHFTKNRLCSRLTPNGRITLTDTDLIVTHNGKKVQRPLGTRAEFDVLLRRHFGIVLY